MNQRDQRLSPAQQIDQLLGIAEELERLIWSITVDLDRATVRSLELIEQVEQQIAARSTEQFVELHSEENADA
ncbi:hypothetical protein [Nitrolancea hollandica]|uniref:Uncharacterized protein n=1 Tax=Nitrolancea hollandica Lb TaxID=1129897 RepID=I4ELB3_9BACT|nr:hypothetical protein [Nitrolancea hollandica]CCF85475.1 hypothetical protein NITHO_500010 [Nitrolancea hollandica Lb]